MHDAGVFLIYSAGVCSGVKKFFEYRPVKCNYIEEQIYRRVIKWNYRGKKFELHIIKNTIGCISPT